MGTLEDPRAGGTAAGNVESSYSARSVKHSAICNWSCWPTKNPAPQRRSGSEARANRYEQGRYERKPHPGRKRLPESLPRMEKVIPCTEPLPHVR